MRDLPAALAAAGRQVTVLTPSYGVFHQLPGAVAAGTLTAEFRGDLEGAREASAEAVESAVPDQWEDFIDYQLRLEEVVEQFRGDLLTDRAEALEAQIRELEEQVETRRTWRLAIISPAFDFHVRCKLTFNRLGNQVKFLDAIFHSIWQSTPIGRYHRCIRLPAFRP